MSTHWPSPSLVKVCEVAGRGRGLVAAALIPAGSPVLCEVAVASTSLSGHEDSEPWAVAALLASALLVSEPVHGLSLTRELQPQTADGLVQTAALAAAIAELRSRAPPAAASSVSDLECARLLHVVQQNALGLIGQQATMWLEPNTAWDPTPRSPALPCHLCRALSSPSTAAPPCNRRVTAV